ncbi:MAG: hypothetical protein Q4D98_08920 [Planctomycetia bacterium]|nr:hypothetical protein [Planctomycetia bacterium]
MNKGWKKRTVYGILLVLLLGLVFQAGCKSFVNKKPDTPNTVEGFLSQPRPGDNLRMEK